MNKDFSLENARSIGLDAAEQLFKNGEQGDVVMLLKGANGRILVRGYKMADFAAGSKERCWYVSTSHDPVGARWRRSIELEGLQATDVIFVLANDQGQGEMRTIEGPGGPVSFRGIRSPDGAEWWHATGWQQTRNGVHT